MAHGQDVANLDATEDGSRLSARPRITRATSWVLRRSAAVISNSRWLADRLTERIPLPDAKIAIADCGVDLGAFSPRPRAEARSEVGWDGEGPAFLCLGSLIERKNVLRLADAFALLGRGRLAFVGDGPLRGALEGGAGVLVTGRVPQSDVPAWVAASRSSASPP